MPPIDLSALRRQQTDLARARLALSKAESRLDADRARLAAAERAWALARARGDTATATRAAREVESLADLVKGGVSDRIALSDTMRDRLAELAKLDLHAPADVPLLLMPLRLETRFATSAAGKPILRVRIHPDDIHLDLTDPGLTPQEEKAGRAYWQALFAAPDDGDMARHWAVLTDAVGASRARGVARSLMPANPALRGTGTAPVFPTVPAPRKSAARMRLLPDFFRATAMIGSTRIRARGKPVDPDLRIGLITDDGTPLIDRDGLPVLEGTEWLVDYDQALRSGMAIELPLRNAGVRIDSLMVYGVCQGRKPSELAADLTALLAAHDAGPGLGFVPQGTATNNTEDDDSGWSARRAAAPLPVSMPDAGPGSNGVRLAMALGLSPDLTRSLPHADAPEGAAAAAMNAALWPATWGTFLDTLDRDDSTLDPALIEDLRHFHHAHLRGRGALPAIAVGDQPYGVLPFAGFTRLGAATKGATRTEIGLDALLRKLLPNWLAAVPALPRMEPGSSADKVLTIFGQAPVSWGVRARKCLGRDFLTTIGVATAQGGESANVEALLTRLLAETLGGFSTGQTAASLDEESRPVALPYADPARDMEVAANLLAGRRAGPISSLFQALVVLGHARLRAAATPPADTAAVLRVTAPIGPALTERVIGAVLSDTLAPIREYDDLIDQMGRIAMPAPTATAPDLTPARLRMSLSAQALQASSAVERDWLGHMLATGLLRARRRLADMEAGLAQLIALSGTPDAPDTGLLVAECVDTASHRLDAWVLALSSARLDRMRAAVPQGISVGAYGWVFDLVPQGQAARSPGQQGGFVAAPALDLATSAGLLRAAYLAHNPTDGSGGAFAIDLSSGRVRRAMALLEGVANGQELTALLGYDFERRLTDADCGRFVLSFRAMAPLRAGRLTDAQSPVDEAQMQALAAVNVTDMLRLLDLWDRQGAASVLQRLDTPPADNAYYDAATQVWAPSVADKDRIRRAIAAARDDADALADLMMAESVHQLASGNMARASAVLDASGRGDAAPPAQPDVIRTQGPGVIVTHRLIAVLPAKGGWTDATPRAMANPALEAWAASRLPRPDRIVLGKGPDGGLVTLAQAGVSALDFAALSRHPGLAARVLRARAPLANALADLIGPGSALIPAGHMALAEADLTAAALQDVLDQARPLTPLGLGAGGVTIWTHAPEAILAAAARLGLALNMLRSRLMVLQRLLGAPDVARPDLVEALLALTDFGIVMPDIAQAQVAGLAGMALSEGLARLDRAQGLLSGAAHPDGIDAAALALFGQGFPMPVMLTRTVPGADDPLTYAQDRPFAPPAPGAVERFLADTGTVRADVGRFQRLNLLGLTHGLRPALTLRQLVSGGDFPPDHWLGSGLPPDRPTPTGTMAALLADAPGGLDLAGPDPICALILDDWTETIAPRAPIGPKGPAVTQATAGVAIHADAPGAEPPQTLILGLSPDGQPWTEDRLCDLLADMLDLAKARLVTLETLPLAARILPAIYTQSWSLQGEPVLDWSRIIGDPQAWVAHPGLKNFTTIREV